MKITELKCTACGGELKVKQETPNLAVCEYCKRQYGIEWENEGNAHFKGQMSQEWYVPREPKQPEAKKKTGWEPYGWKRGVALAVFGVVAILAMNFKGIKARYELDKVAKAESVVDAPVEAAAKPQTEALLFAGGLEEFVERAFLKPQEQVTPEELAQITRLDIRYSDGWELGYSMKGAEELTLIKLSSNDSSFKAVNHFTGLKELSVNGNITSEMVKGLHLTNLKCYTEDIEVIVSALEFPDELEELNVAGSISRLDGIGALKSLTSLTVNADDITDLAPLAQAKNLKKIELLRCNQISDFSVLPTLTTLLELSIDSDTLRGLGFLEQMPQLTALSLEDATLNNLDGIQGLSKLKSLSIMSCDDTQNMNALSRLTSLESLSLEIPYGCEEPDLSSLTELKTLYLEDMSNLDFLASMPNLHSLNLRACTVNDPSVFSRLSGLEELSCSNLSGEMKDWSFVGRLPALLSLNLTGVSTYEDISSLFNHPTIETLLLNGVECEINFKNINQNNSLRELGLSGVKLYKNVNIQGGGGIYQINYDSVNLADHMDFLINFPNLEILNLSGNKLADLTAVQSLMQLRELNIEENFITDLKPLTGLTILETLYVKGNPVENYQILSDKVNIIK